MTALTYRKKPVSIQAIQFDGNNFDDIQQFATVHLTKLEDGTFEIPTLEGNMKASMGDYIICGVDGEYYPCKPDIFEKTYDLNEPLLNSTKPIRLGNEDAKLNKTPEIYYKEKIFTPRCWKLKCIRRNLSDRIDDIKAFFRRGRNGYSLRDVWNINTWFLETLSHMLNDLLIGGMSYPGRGEADTYEKWQAILKRMKYCCEEAIEPSEKNEWEDTFDLKMNFGPIDPKTNTGEITFECDNEENHQKYRERESEIYDYQQQMQNEALELFVKWFNDLWD